MAKSSSEHLRASVSLQARRKIPSGVSDGRKSATRRPHAAEAPVESPPSATGSRRIRCAHHPIAAAIRRGELCGHTLCATCVVRRTIDHQRVEMRILGHTLRANRAEIGWF